MLINICDLNAALIRGQCLIKDGAHSRKCSVCTAGIHLTQMKDHRSNVLNLSSWEKHNVRVTLFSVRLQWFHDLRYKTERLSPVPPSWPHTRGMYSARFLVCPQNFPSNRHVLTLFYLIANCRVYPDYTTSINNRSNSTHSHAMCSVSFNNLHPLRSYMPLRHRSWFTEVELLKELFVFFDRDCFLVVLFLPAPFFFSFGFSSFIAI